MKNYSFLEVIDFWTPIVQENPSPLILESAFFQIFVAFEKDLNETFILFSLGKSHSTFSPDRKLNFTEEIQLTELIKGDGNFVDYSKAIDRCSKHIFHTDIFSVIFSSASHATELNKMRVIRNYLAHRSRESEEKYIRSVLTNVKPEDFLLPGEFLTSRQKKGGQIWFWRFVECLKEINLSLRNDAILKSVPRA